MYVRTYVHTYVCTYICTYVHTYIHTYIHTCMHTCIHTYIHTHIHACMQKWQIEWCLLQPCRIKVLMFFLKKYVYRNKVIYLLMNGFNDPRFYCLLYGYT